MMGDDCFVIFSGSEEVTKASTSIRYAESGLTITKHTWRSSTKARTTCSAVPCADRGSRRIRRSIRGDRLTVGCREAVRIYRRDSVRVGYWFMI
jgi:hypothetical protein